jgi:hypothetical protein
MSTQPQPWPESAEGVTRAVLGMYAGRRAPLPVQRPRIDADALDALVLAALRDFYTSHLDEAEQAIAGWRDEQHQARAGYTRELAEVQEQLVSCA